MFPAQKYRAAFCGPARYFYRRVSDQSNEMLDQQGNNGYGDPAGKAQEDGAQPVGDEGTDIGVEADGTHCQDDGELAGGA